MPACSETFLHVKEILLHGQSTVLENKTRVEVKSFFKHVGLDLSMESLVGDEFVCNGELDQTLIIDESSDEDVIDEEGHLDEGIQQFWETTPVLNSNCEVKHCSPGCRNECQEVATLWSPEDLEGVEIMFSGRRLIRKKNKLISHLVAQGNIGILTDYYVIKSRSFCLKYMNFLTKISEYVLRKVIEDYQRGIRHYEHGNKGILKQPSVATISFVSWFKHFLSLYGPFFATILW